MYYSQSGQDKWVHDLIGDKGFFVDVGAYDGIQTSNTYFLEQKGWNGICIEGSREIYYKLKENRKSKNVHKAVTDHTGFLGFAADRIGGNNITKCDTLDNILISQNCQKEIDYLSIDIEGHELTVFSCFDFSKWDIKLMTVEHNLYFMGSDYKNKLYDLLTANGFIRIVEDVKCLDPNPMYFDRPYEDWYAKEGLIK